MSIIHDSIKLVCVTNLHKVDIYAYFQALGSRPGPCLDLTWPYNGIVLYPVIIELVVGTKIKEMTTPVHYHILF